MQARLYEIPENKVCVAFLTNTNTKFDGTVKFRGVDYFLPRHSISILPDCKTVVYNNQQVIRNNYQFTIKFRVLFNLFAFADKLSAQCQDI